MILITLYAGRRRDACAPRGIRVPNHTGRKSFTSAKTIQVEKKFYVTLNTMRKELSL